MFGVKSFIAVSEIIKPSKNYDIEKEFEAFLTASIRRAVLVITFQGKHLVLHFRF